MGKIDKKENLSKLPKHGSFWRRHIDSTVVDLRTVKASNPKSTRVSLKSTNIEPPPMSEHVNEYIDAIKTSARPRRANINLEYPDVLSQEEILRQISEIEMRDVLIEDALPKSQRYFVKEATQVFKKPQVADEQKYGELSRGRGVDKEQEEDISVSDEKINLIPPTIHSEYLPSLQDIPEKQLKKYALQDNSSKRHLWSHSISKPKPKPKKGRRKSQIAVFILVALFVSGGIFTSFKAMAFEEEATIRAEKAYSYMSSGKNALEKLDADEAREYFLRAEKEFIAIEQGFGFLPAKTLNLATILPFHSSFSSAAHLIKAGKAFSSAGYEISNALQPLKDSSPANNSTEEQSNFTDNLVMAGLYIQKAKNYIVVADSHLSRVRVEDVPSGFENEILNFQNYNGYVEELFDEALSSLDVLLSFLGHQKEKTYILAFQNSSELRATGGFMGTYGLLTLNKGSIKELDIDGIYNPDGQLSINIIPPKPLQYVTPNFGTRDANWFFDFPSSAQKIMELLGKTGGPTTDGVIGITPVVVEKLLRLTGPIAMPSYGVTLDANNFLELVQQEVEEDYDRELNRPKQILADLAPILLEKLEKSDKQIEILNIIFESLGNKDMLVFSKDKEVQKFLEEKNWGGKVTSIRSPNSVVNDYLAIVFSNVGGGKTDKYIDTEVDTVTELNDNGDIIRTVVISRRHNGGSTPYEWYNGPSYGYLRIYVPEGSELISAEGFSEEPSYIKTNYEKEGYIKDLLVAEIESTLSKHELSNTDIFKESDKTVFGNWLYVPAGERKFVQIKYKLPHEINSSVTSYNLTIQKQSGLYIDYSGSIEGFDDFLDIKNCRLDGKSLSMNNQFAFFQTNDKDISCR